MLRLTPEILAAAYDYLRTTQPIAGWKIPPASDVTFKVTFSRDPIGMYTFCEGTHIISASDKQIGHTHTLLALIAHEIVHMYRRMLGHPKWDNHGVEFKRLSRAICRVHGFDPKEF